MSYQSEVTAEIEACAAFTASRNVADARVNYATYQSARATREASLATLYAAAPSAAYTAALLITPKEPNFDISQPGVAAIRAEAEHRQ